MLKPPLPLSLPPLLLGLDPLQTLALEQALLRLLLALDLNLGLGLTGTAPRYAYSNGLYRSALGTRATLLF